MGWGRIDDGFDEHAKVLALLDEEDPADAHAAIALWTLCFTWAHRNTRRKGRTPGLIPTGLPRRQLGAAGREAAKVLVRHGLWDEHPEGWLIHDFVDYLPTEETRAARAEAGRRGAAKRWASKHAAESTDHADTLGDGKLPSPDSTLPFDSHPPDGNVEANDGSRARARRGTTGSTTDNPIPEPEPEKTPSESFERADARRTATTSRGTRLPEDWEPGQALIAWHHSHEISGVKLTSLVDLDTELLTFRNYWLSKTGKDATKRDWDRTFQNWLIEAARRAQQRYQRGTLRASPRPALPTETDLTAGWKGLRS